MNYDHNKSLGYLQFHSGYGKFNLNSPKGYSLKIINAQTDRYQVLNMTKRRHTVQQFVKMLKDWCQ